MPWYIDWLLLLNVPFKEISLIGEADYQEKTTNLPQVADKLFHMKNQVDPQTEFFCKRIPDEVQNRGSMVESH